MKKKEITLRVVHGKIAVTVFCFFLSGCSTVTEFFNPFFELADWTQEDTTVTEIVAKTDTQGKKALLLSAFYGLDNALPEKTKHSICADAPNKDGMPVIFSHELDVSSVQAADFRVTTESGEIGHVNCTTFNPANDKGELRTVLLVGDFGSIGDQPSSVEITGNILSIDKSVNFKGLKVDVVPLEDGPSIALAAIVPKSEWELGKQATSLRWGGGSGCPVGTRLVIRVTWQGGVTKPGGADADDNERQLYIVTFKDDGGEKEFSPDALADLNDSDNNHKLCFTFEGTPIRVSFPKGHMTDPREDLNHYTQINVSVSEE